MIQKGHCGKVHLHFVRTLKFRPSEFCPDKNQRYSVIQKIKIPLKICEKLMRIINIDFSIKLDIIFKYGR